VNAITWTCSCGRFIELKAGQREYKCVHRMMRGGRLVPVVFVSIYIPNDGRRPGRGYLKRKIEK